MSVDTSALLVPGSIRLHERAATKEDAVRMCGEALVSSGAVSPAYVHSMLEREVSMSTFLGEGVAIPHVIIGPGPIGCLHVRVASGKGQDQALQMVARRGRISFSGGLPKDDPTITLGWTVSASSRAAKPSRSPSSRT